MKSEHLVMLPYYLQQGSGIDLAVITVCASAFEKILDGAK